MREGLPDLLPGHQLGPYAVDSVLSSGEETSVYLVQHVRRGTWHALKVFKTAGPQMTERLRREAMLRTALDHPNIVPGRQLIDALGAPGLLMDFVEGTSLEEHLSRRRLAPHEAVELFRAIASAAAHAHAHGLIHRDLRPGNILLQPDGPDRLVPRVLGWGLAKVRDGAAFTTVHRAMGTPGYAAPEQIQDAASTTPAADVFSLGVLLYEMLSGVAPFAGKSELGAALAARNRDLLPLSTRCPELPEPLTGMVRAMLDPDPAHRPTDGGEVVALLPRVQAPPPPPEPELPRPALEWLGWAALAPVAASLLGLAVVLAAR